jgi:gamma-glutamyltranspeptidase/glutathione hydrolase
MHRKLDHQLTATAIEADPAAPGAAYARGVRGPAESPFSYELPYASRRVPLLARQAVATSHPLAAQAGLRVLEHGGNAVDAAIAVAATLTVVEPTMNGVGGDLFALVWDGNHVHALNASGKSPEAWSRARFAGRERMPELGWDSVTVPGAVSGWSALSRRFGSVPFRELLAPAIRYAREGFPVMPGIAALWAEGRHRFAAFEEFQRVFAPGGRTPRAGEWFTLPELADTLSEIAETGGDSFYSGRLARVIAAAAAADGAVLGYGDLAAHEPAWVEPVSIDFHDATLYEPPPNGAGLAALIALGILRRLPLEGLAPDDPDAIHLQIEAMKAAFAECRAHLGDPRRMRRTSADLLSEPRLSSLTAAIRQETTQPPRTFPPTDHGTVYAAVADRNGWMVSLIQSNYLGFGSGVVVPGTGISLHNRGLGFSLERGHVNAVAGGIRPYHTIMPGFLKRGGEPAMAFGVMGGHMQPQGQVQLVLRTVLHGQNPQAACDAPRWHVTEDSRVALEPEFHPDVAHSLARRGHRLLEDAPRLLFGGAQAIHRVGLGYCAASDMRKDGQAVGS